MKEPNDSGEKRASFIWGAIHARFGSRPGLDNLEALKLCPIFQDLTSRELKHLCRLIYERSYQSGEYLFEKGQPGTAMFIIKSGMVKVTVPGSEGEADLATIMPEDFLGELALLDDTPRSASARAEEKTEALAFFREDLNELAETRPGIAVKIMKGLAVIIGQRLKAANEQLMAGVQ